jgi:hypothetical protein
MQPPVRRVLAIDAGSRRFKLLLAQSDFGRVRVVKEEEIDLQAEGLVSAEETKAYLQERLDLWGRPPLALALPQHVTISQVIDLPLAAESEVDKLIRDETVKLSGVSESRIVYDFVQIQSPSPTRQRFWVTLCQEGDIRDRILKLGLENEDLCEVTTTANALTTAYQATSSPASRAILIHVGAQTTVVVILLDGQAAASASFQMGGDFLTRALARALNCAEEKAESLKEHTDYFSGPSASPEFLTSVEGWAAELKRQLNDWFADNPGLASQTSTFELIGGGGVLEQPGFLDYMRNEASLNIRPWPKKNDPAIISPAAGFEVAFGTALQALGCSGQPVSLLPEDFRQAWRKRLDRQRIEFASVILLVICTLMLSVATWHKLSLVERKKSLLRKVTAGQEAFSVNETLSGALVTDYEVLRPVFAAQKNTLDTLEALTLLQNSRSNRSFWFVVVADQQSYFSAPLPPPSTNRPARTNISVSLPERSPAPGTVTNISQAKPGLIAELSVPEDAERARSLLSELVTGLRRGKLFSKADLLSDDLRRNIADPKVVLPERHFVLSLDFAETDYQQPVKIRAPLVKRSEWRSRAPGIQRRIEKVP